MSEEWRPIPGFEGIYSASNLGRVLSHGRRCDAPQGTRRVKERVLRVTRHFRRKKLVCCTVALRLPNDPKVNSYTTAKLVLLAFVGAPKDWQVAHYVNGDCADARLENVEWSSFSVIAKDSEYAPPVRRRRRAA